MNYDQLIDGNSAASGKALAAIVRITRSFTMPAWARTVTGLIYGAGGGGARAGGSPEQAGGGNSAPWGGVTLDVVPGKVLTFNLGAGGAQKLTAGAGNPGSASTLVYDGLTVMTVNGAEGGAYSASGPTSAPTPVATVTGADFWVPGLPAYNTSSGVSGGAATNIFNILASELSMTENQRGRGVAGADGIGTPLMGLIHLNMPMLFFSTTVGHPGVGGDGSVPPGWFAGGYARDSAGNTVLEGGQGGGGGGGCRGGTAQNNKGGNALGYCIIRG
jgi:hypothetical protein